MNEIVLTRRKKGLKEERLREASKLKVSPGSGVYGFRGAQKAESRGGF